VTNSNAILVTAAAGQTGTRLIRLLVQRGAQVRGLVTKRSSAEKVQSLGATPFVGDLRDAQALGDAMKGVSKVYHIAPTLSYDEHAMGRIVVEAAQAAGVEHFVLHGVIAPYLQNINYHYAKEKVQWDLYRSGMPYSVLLPTNFMQNISWSWPTIASQGRWELSYDVEKRLTWVDVGDVAEAAANVLTEAGHEYGTYELCGKDAFLSRREIASLMTCVMGRRVDAVKTDQDEYLEKYRNSPFFARTTQEELDQIREMFSDYDKFGMPAGNPKVLSMLLHRDASSYRDFLEKLNRAETVPGITSYGLPATQD
jgi:NAD(P)H dehydrogenase (quinone)